MGRFGEPWTTEIDHEDGEMGYIKPFVEAICCSDGERVEFCGTTEQAKRIVACVNALEGYDPAKVRALLEELCAGRNTPPSTAVLEVGTKTDCANYGGDIADWCWATKARDCWEGEV